MKRKFLAGVLIAAGFLAGCKKKDDSGVDVAAADKAAKQEVVNDYAQMVYLNYLDTYNTAVSFQNKVNTFVASPADNGGLEGLRQSWLDMRVPYLQSEAYRFYGGPIDGADPNVEGDLNSWPVDENYIDYVVGSDKVTVDYTTGIINSTNPKYATIDQALIKSQNTVGGDDNISSGYHAIEFLLWGQDLSTTGPGNRQYTDYTTLGNADRRRTYLKQATDLLVNELGLLLDQWKPGGTYRTQFVGQDPQASLTLIFDGIANLTSGELPIERIKNALDTQDQEQEHSCFSDNTHNDIRYDVIGVENVLYGRYVSSTNTVYEGKGIDELIKSKNEALYDTIIAKFADAKSKAFAIQPPFDREIIGDDSAPGRIRVKATVDAILKENQSINNAAKLLGITITTAN